MVVDLAALEAAAAHVYAAMPPTPQFAWPLLSARAGCEVWVKHENHTPTGAFKVRGGLNLVAALAGRRQAPTRVITATRGNENFANPQFAARTERRNRPIFR